MGSIEFLKEQIADYEEIISEVQQGYDRMKVVASANIGGARFFEVRLERKYPKETGYRYVGTINLGLGELKELGVCSRLNSFRKVQAWLNTIEGKDYIMRSQVVKYQERRAGYVARLEKELANEQPTK